MKLIKLAQHAALALGFLAGSALPAHAQTDTGSWYVGGGLGVAKVNDTCKNQPRRTCDDQGSGFRVFGGLHLNRYFALEATLDIASDFLAPAARAAGYDGSTSTSFFGINAIGSLPIGERVSLFGGVSGVFTYVNTDVTQTRYHDGTYTTCYYDGYNYYDSWYSYCTNNSYDHRHYEDDSSVAAGALVGIDVQVANRIHVRAQAQRYFDVRGDFAFGGRRDVDNFTLNALYSFR